MRRSLLFNLGKFLALLACFSGSTQIEFASFAKDAQLKLFWVSLDGLKREDVLRYTATLKNPHPKGFKSLLGQDKNWSIVQVTNPTITSSSHISTITCAGPGVHGILANKQWNGESIESGFDAPYSTETFVHALRKQGKVVSVLGYPSFDAKSENRTADFSSSYDNSPIKSQFIEIGEKSVPVAFSSRVVAGGLIEGFVTFDKNKRIASLNFGKFGVFQVKESEFLNAFFEQEGIKQRVSFRLFQKANAQFPTLYIGPTTVNVAHPATFRKALDDLNLVFSSGKDFQVRSAFGDEAFTETMLQRLDYFQGVAATILSQNKSDVFFLYLEDLDVLGHQFAGVSQADGIRAKYFAELDSALGSLLEKVPASADVLLVGDHGMSAINYELSGTALLPAHAREHFTVKSSGGSLFLYGKTKESVKTLPPVHEPWFKETLEALRLYALPHDPSRKLFPRVIVKGDASSLAEGWSLGVALPWIAASATPGVAIVETVEPGLLKSLRKGFVLPPGVLAQSVGGDPLKLPEPLPLGQHGHYADSSEMLTSVITFGPNFSKKALQLGSQTSNLQLVPFVADALGLNRPEACQKDSKKKN